MKKTAKKSAKKRYIKPKLKSELLNKFGEENFLLGASYQCHKCNPASGNQPC